MPQLDLSWFSINFFLAWFLIILVWLVINTQTWNINKNENNEPNTQNTNNNNNWNW